MFERFNDKVEKFIVIEIDLIEKYPIKLKIVYNYYKEKKYIIREALVVNDKIITDKQVELKELKVFFNKFISNKLNVTHHNRYLKQCQKKVSDRNGEYILKTLKIDTLKIYLNDIDVQVLLNVWNDSLLGFSRILMSTQKKLIVSTANSILFNGSNFITDSKHRAGTHIKPNQLFIKTIKNELLTGNLVPEELDYKLKTLQDTN